VAAQQRLLSESYVGRLLERGQLELTAWGSLSRQQPTGNPFGLQLASK